MANTPIEPVLNNSACEKIIENTFDGTLVMCDGEVPYAIPINHAYLEGRFYFHGAIRGRKIDTIKRNPNVVYVISKYHNAPDAAAGQNCHGPWESIIAYGTARVIEDVQEKAEVFERFMRYYGDTKFQMTEQARKETSGIVLTVTSMTARSEVPPAKKEYWLWLPPKPRG